MSLVTDQVRRLDIQLDNFQLFGALSTLSSPVQVSSTDGPFDTIPLRAPTTRVTRLKAIVRALSTTSTSRPLLKASKLLDLLGQTRALQSQTVEQRPTDGRGRNDTDLEWMVVGKATVQTYGLMLYALLEQTIPLSDDIWYWDEVLGSYAYTGLYTLQTSPVRLWQQAREVYEDAKQRYLSQSDAATSTARTSETISARWKQFYSLLQRSFRERSMSAATNKILSPFALCRSEARQKQNALKKLREMNASGLGLLMDEGLSFEVDDEESATAKEDYSPSKDEWRSTLAKSISLMETILRNVTVLEVGVSEFEDGVFTSVENDPEIVQNQQDEGARSARPALLTDRLIRILIQHLPAQESSSKALFIEYGRPSRIVRYWLPASALLLSGSTLLRIAANRRTEIVTWIREFGATVIDFWSNWVIEPVKKLIGTIRHDEDSEVAIMSKESLKADRESLERMVVDFAMDHPEGSSGGGLSQEEIATIRAKVKEGDLTSVLKAYERDLQRPFMGTVRGDLVRALLIQIQKTKVDVEVAIGGIDALLKSQELVFGFVGLTPGILVTFAVVRWIGGTFGNRKGLRRNRKQGEMIRVLRNIDRILNASKPTTNGMLSYKDHGLLLCEVHVLRQKAVPVIPGEFKHNFLEDVNDLVDISIGIERQVRVVERIRWAYSKWLH